MVLFGLLADVVDDDVKVLARRRIPSLKSEAVEESGNKRRGEKK
jgi:hypothetical protein